MPELTVETLPSDAPHIGRVSSPRSFDGLPGKDLNRLPALRSEAGWLGETWLQAASIAGRSHRDNRNSTSGQDVYGYAQTAEADGSVITALALADGLGSKKQSHIGATLAVRVACHEILQAGHAFWCDPTDEQMRQVALAINTRMLKGTSGREHDVGTTLAVLVLVAQPRLSVRGFRIGDPEGFVLTGSQALRPLWTTPEGQSGAINQVDSYLPSTDELEIIVEMVRYEMDDSDIGLALLSDGVSNDVTSDSRVSQWCAARWTSPLDAYAMADTLRYQRQGSSDDRTALALLLAPYADRGGVSPPMKQASKANGASLSVKAGAESHQMNRSLAKEASRAPAQLVEEVESDTGGGEGARSSPSVGESLESGELLESQEAPAIASDTRRSNNTRPTTSATHLTSVLRRWLTWVVLAALVAVAFYAGWWLG